MKTLLQIIQECEEKYTFIKSIINEDLSNLRLNELDILISDKDFWNDNKQAKIIMKERQKISDLLDKNKYFSEQLSFFKEYLELFPNEIDGDIENQIIKFGEEISEFEFKQLMSDPNADNPAILTISAGAGGLEAANWVSILFRMYCRWADNNGFKLEILDMKPSDEHSAICIDSVSISVTGKYAYGYLKGESGIMRLIRNSPFNSGAARHTSFAAVSVLPDIEDTIDVKIDDKDIEVTAQRGSGAGGQSINTCCSAVRLRHFPTGINILVRTERDQLANKKTAFKMLKAKLYEIELKKKEVEKNKQLDNLKDNSFGNQIKTYTMSPYSLVKDHRTGYETSNVDRVLDGEIQDFIIAFLRNR